MEGLHICSNTWLSDAAHPDRRQSNLEALLWQVLLTSAALEHPRQFHCLCAPLGLVDLQKAVW